MRMPSGLLRASRRSVALPAVFWGQCLSLTMPDPRQVSAQLATSKLTCGLCIVLSQRRGLFGLGSRGRWAFLSHGLVLQNTKGAGVEQRVLQALLAKRFPKIVAQLEKADTSVEVCNHSSRQCSNLQSARL